LEESYLVERGKGVIRYDVSQLPSNSPIEDDRSERIVQVPLINENEDVSSSDWMFWGVYDGHSGWTTSAKLRESLISYVVNELDKVYTKSSAGSIYRLVPSAEAIDNAIKQGFLRLDDDIVNKGVSKLLDGDLSKAAAAEIIAPALSGSCGLLAFYDTNSEMLRVAVTGDSRAVLGRQDDSGNWTAMALSTDQTGSNDDEANRVRSEHPGEESTCIRNGRVLGALEPTRAFGDARYKWARDIQHAISHKFFGRSIPRELKTPPYVTAEPVVTCTQIRPSMGDFMVIGCDGLFELLSNEEVVGLVVQWIKEKHPEYMPMPSHTATPGGLWNRIWARERRRSGDGPNVEDVSQNKEAQKQPIRRRAGIPLQATVQDDNCATHLIRNALGGGDHEQVSMLVSIPSPMSRSYRDDLTVTVVFFGNQGEPDDGGPVKVNTAATKNHGRTPRAKL
jgi:pyruvate dehydrogenase phosphatase